MPDRVEVQNITCPPAVTATAPQETIIDGVVGCVIRRITIRIPAGHAGLTGLALGYGHNPVLPRGAGDFISGDDEVIIYDLSEYPPGPQWQAFTINADTQAHAWQLRFEVDEMRPTVSPAQPVPLDPADIMAVGSELIGV